jgi:hypothetical protein
VGGIKLEQWCNHHSNQTNRGEAMEAGEWFISACVSALAAKKKSRKRALTNLYILLDLKTASGPGRR